MILKQFIPSKKRKSLLTRILNIRQKMYKRKATYQNFNSQSGASNKIKCLKHTIVKVPEHKNQKSSEEEA